MVDVEGHALQRTFACPPACRAASVVEPFAEFARLRIHAAGQGQFWSRAAMNGVNSQDAMASPVSLHQDVKRLNQEIGNLLRNAFQSYLTGSTRFDILLALGFLENPQPIFP